MSKKRKLKKRVKELERKLKKRGLKRIPGDGGAIHIRSKAAGVVAPKPEFKIPDYIVALSSEEKSRIGDLTERIFQAAKPPEWVPKANALAMDAAIKKSCHEAALALDQQIVAIGGWGGVFGGYGAFAEGQMFLGYPYLSELAQRPEYRVISETPATEMTRKWISIKSRGDTGDKSDKIHQLEEEFKRLGVREVFGECAEYDGFMGRDHLFLDVGDSGLDDADELKIPIGDGLNNISRAKLKVGSLKRIQRVEAVWCYPTGYNTNNPLSPDWYNPQMWFAMGKQVHVSRLLPFIGRKVPDMLKPAYSFGGLSLSQMVKPYVDNWLRTRQSVSDLLHAFTVWSLGTDLTALMQDDGQELTKRIQIFNNYRDNKGLFLTNKDVEEMKNISAPLGTLDALQAQSQEQMCSVSKTPTVKLLGIDAHGLNASSEGSIRTYYDTINAYQPKFFGPNLDRIFHIAQISLWGKVDPDLFYEFEPLWSLDEKGKAEVEKIRADTDAVYIEAGSIDASESRSRIANSPDSEYQSLDLNKVIQPPEELDVHGIGLGQGGGLGGNQESSFKEAAE